MDDPTCAVCASRLAAPSLATCSPQCWTRWVGASPTERAVTTAARDARIYGAVKHLGRSVPDLAAETGLSQRSVWHIVQMRHTALSAPEPLFVSPDGQSVPDTWHSAVAAWGRPGMVLAANLLLLGRIRVDDQSVQRYLCMGQHRLRRMLNEFTEAGLTRRVHARDPTGPVWVHELVSPTQRL